MRVLQLYMPCEKTFNPGDQNNAKDNPGKEEKVGGQADE